VSNNTLDKINLVKSSSQIDNPLRDCHSRNGQLIDAEIARDRGFLYGDGVFTTMLYKNGQYFFQKEHWQRLVHDAHRLRIQPISLTTFCELPQNLFKNVSQQDFVVRTSLTRSEGRGYRGEIDSMPQIYCSLFPYSAWPEHLRVKVCHSRLSRNPQLAGIKHLNRLEQILATQELDPCFDEGILMDTKGFVIEGTFSNLIWYANKQFFSPKLDYAGVNGIAKVSLLKALRQKGHVIVESQFDLKEIVNCEALWMCNSVRGIKAVISLENLSSAERCECNTTEFQSRQFTEHHLTAMLKILWQELASKEPEDFTDK